MVKRALILGVGGQDGSYLADILTERVPQEYEVHGTYRRRSGGGELRRVEHLTSRLGSMCVHLLDVTEPLVLRDLFVRLRPDEVYHVADQDRVDASGGHTGHQLNVGLLSAVSLLETVAAVRPECRVFLPSSVTVFGPSEPPQDETTPLNPNSPYALAKAGVLLAARHWRREHGLHVSCGIMGNHDGPRRGGGYLLQRICRAIRPHSAKPWTAADGKLPLRLYDLNHRVDIGFAREYMEAAVAMLRQEQPDDYVIATGTHYAVGGLARRALAAAGMWSGGLHDPVPPELLVELRAPEGAVQPELLGNPAKARRALGFSPRHRAGEVIDLLLAARELP